MRILSTDVVESKLRLVYEHAGIAVQVLLPVDESNPDDIAQTNAKVRRDGRAGCSKHAPSASSSEGPACEVSTLLEGPGALEAQQSVALDDPRIRLWPSVTKSTHNRRRNKHGRVGVTR